MDTEVIIIKFEPLASSDQLARIEHALHHLIHIGEHIMVAQTQTAEDIKAISAQLGKIGTETTTLLKNVADLEAALAKAGDTSQEVTDALTALKAQAQVVDDMVPDAPTPA